MIGAGPPEQLLKWVELYSPIVAGMSFFVGLFVRGKMNDKAIRDLTTAVTDMIDTVFEVRESVALLKQADEEMQDDIEDLEEQQRTNTVDIHNSRERTARLEGIHEASQRPLR